MKRFSIGIGALVVMMVGMPSVAFGEPGLQPVESFRKSAPLLRYGYLFVDGEYLTPPYEIDFEGDQLWINGEAYASDYFDLSGFELEAAEAREWFESTRRDRGTGRRGRGLRHRWSDHFDLSYEDLTGVGLFASSVGDVELNSVVVLAKGYAPLVVDVTDGGSDVLASLLEPEKELTDTSDSVELREQFATWQTLLASFQPTSGFRERAESDLSRWTAVIKSNDESTEASLQVARLSYPMTMFAMVVVVLGFGHLLSNRPNLEYLTEWSQRKSVVTKSLLLVGLLSAVDLVWTLAATHAGAMREMNPLGSELVNNPVQLALFKLAVTGGAIAILYRLHQKPVAQVASWWCCLVLTLLTSRWLVFQSMFM